jgi:glycerophosphoryl diester phosphodiesterase
MSLSPVPTVQPVPGAPLLVCHMAVLSGRHRRNSLAAIRECFDLNVGRIEIDIHSLDGDDYAVYHDRRLEGDTTGSGSIGAATPDAIRALRYTEFPDDRPALLSEVVEMARGCDTEMQLDWKDLRLMSPQRIGALVDAVAPVRERVIVSCPQDWNLRLLRDTPGAPATGFDPGYYLAPERPGPLPRNAGAYGYRDDHPLALRRGDPAPVYLAARMEALLAQAPGSREFFLDYRLVLQMLDDGFDAAAWLHGRGIGANVWTADYRAPDDAAWLRRLLDAAIDRVTTNTAPAWAAAFAVS